MSTHNATFQCLLDGRPHSIHIAYSTARDDSDNRDYAWLAFLRAANKLGKLSSVKLRKVEEL